MPPADDGSAPIEALPVMVPPDHASLHYSGRFDLGDPKTALCAWPASAVVVRFEGTAINANLGVGSNRMEVILDGKPLKILTGNRQDSRDLPVARLYAIAAALPKGEHTVTIFKCTEANCGNTQFLGFQLNAGAAVLPVPPFQRKITIVGDSISAGYGNEAAGKEQHFSPDTENAYWTYGAITARAVGADYTCVAWSGRTMWPAFTMPEIYDRILPRNAASHWGGDKQKPDVILVNLCTNDFGGKNVPDGGGWMKAYKEFVARLRAESPGATIYCALSPMLNDNWPPLRNARSLARGYIQQVVKEISEAGDGKVRYIEFDQQDESNGLGADWHPSVKTNQIMAGKFLEALKSDLKWESQ